MIFRKGVAEWILRHSDAALAIAVAGVVAMMILPLPTWLLDLLITSNISMAVLLLLVVLYVPEPLAIATFPTVLLLTTLYRLALNVSSTRLILLQADAGDVINAFGNFVVSSNYIVGAVIFLILTLIQFIVIAKGSERVAEVAARFTLDAMPGKQMSIDADLRAGIIDSREARRRRANLEREAQFYGAMDGGMRFVKGDVIAGICITVINIVAGLIIGVVQMGMEVREAALTFSLLTIGDGLVSQIPALVISTSAGFVITRVASEESGTHLGLDIGRQILAQPRALKIVSLLLIGIGIIPGMPFGPFLALGCITGFIGWSIGRGEKKKALRRAGDEQKAGIVPAGGEREGEGGALLCAVSVELAGELAGGDDGPGAVALKLQERVPAIREKLFEELGLKLPPVHIRTAPRAATDANYAILVNEVPELRGMAFEGRIYTALAAGQLADAGIDALEGIDPSGRFMGSWIEESSRDRLAIYEAGFMEPHAYIAACLEWTARRNADELVGAQQVQEMLDILEASHPALVRNAVPKPVELSLLTDVSRRLVSEGISLRYMEKIVETLVAWVPREKDPVSLTELVRASLKRYLSSKYTSPDGKMDAFILSPVIEDAVRSSLHKTDAGSYLALAPEITKSILAAVKKEIDPYSSFNRKPAVVVTEADVRRYFKKLVETDFPDIAVLSFGEIESRTILRPMGEISIGRHPINPG
ncbi:MAG: type III secretion system export apparatus subunit SctV [Pseudomonadota bacterium]